MHDVVDVVDTAGEHGTRRHRAPTQVITDTDQRTTIAAFDAAHQQVGSVDLVHGTIVLGDEYEADAGKQAQGRDLHVKMGAETLEWQTFGFSDTSHMPPLPPYQATIAALLADPHVQPVLAKWKVGWLDVPSAGGEVAYFASGCTPSGGISTAACNGNGATVSCPFGGGLSTQACNVSGEFQGVSVIT